MDLVSPVKGKQGERMVLPNFFQGEVLIGTSRIPDSSDVCAPGGSGFVMAISPFTGGRLPSSFFDMNGDGAVNTTDTLNGVPVSGLGFDNAPNNPIFIGNLMLTTLDNASTSATRTATVTGSPGRVSWREMVGN